LSVAAAAIKKNRLETEERHRQREEERKRKGRTCHRTYWKLEEAARLREFVRAVEKQTAQSDFSEEERNDIQQVVEWTKKYADLLDPLSDLPDAMEEFVRPESRHWWLE
jgi:hypothetical protein